MTRETFETHRCGSMPRGISLRRYLPTGGRVQRPEPGGWVISFTDCDPDWDYTYLHPVNPHRGEGARFCPWCGERLDPNG